MSAQIDDIEEQARQRKARLQALRSKRQGKIGKDGEDAQPVIVFRNYTPMSENMAKPQLDKAKPAEVDSHISEQIEAAKQKEVSEVNLSNLAPRKSDWDLKRDIAEKLVKLERKTQKALVELTQERILKEMSDQEDLAAAVNAGTNDVNYHSD